MCKREDQKKFLRITAEFFGDGQTRNFKYNTIKDNTSPICQLNRAIKVPVCYGNIIVISGIASKPFTISQKYEYI